MVAALAHSADKASSLGGGPWPQAGDLRRHGERPAVHMEAAIKPFRPGILVVDDENSIRTLLRIALQRQGFAVWVAASGREALDLYDRHHDDIGLVLLDVRMPIMDGPQTLAALRKINPRLRCCFLSGHSGEYTEPDLLQRGAAQVFTKPFRLGELGASLWQLTALAERRGA